MGNGLDWTGAYNANGNMLTRIDNATSETMAFEWDAEDRLVAVVRDDGETVRRTEFTYDGFGRRVRLQELSAESGTQDWGTDADRRFVWDGLAIAGELSGAGAPVAWFIARALRRFLGQSHVGTLHIEPGSPWQNDFAESFIARVKDELLGVVTFTSMKEAEVIGHDWRRDYDARRPHSSLGYLTPSAFGAQWHKNQDAEPGTRHPRSPSPLGGRGQEPTTNNYPQPLIAAGT